MEKVLVMYFFSGKFLGPKILGVILSIMQHHRNSDSLDSGYIQIYRSAFAQQYALKINKKQCRKNHFTKQMFALFYQCQKRIDNSFLDKIPLNCIFQSSVQHTPKIQQLRYKRKACVTITTNATLNAVLVQKKITNLLSATVWIQIRRQHFLDCGELDFFHFSVHLFFCQSM